MSKRSSLLVIAACGLSLISGFSVAEPSTQATSQTPHLEVPELVQIMAIDGQEKTGNFFGARAMTLDVSVGEHVLSVRYTQLFQLGADDHDILRSKPMAIRFTAEAGKTYQLKVTPPKRYEAAKEFAKQPDIRLIDKTAGTSQQAVLIKSYAEASLVDSIGKAFQSSDDSAAIKATASDNVQLLQDIWSRATTEERQAFAAWLASKAATAK